MSPEKIPCDSLHSLKMLDCVWENRSDVEFLEELCQAGCSIYKGIESDSNDRSQNLGLAFALVTGASLSTSLGAGLVFFDKCVTQANQTVLASCLGLSAGVMLYVSFVEIFLKSVADFVACECLWESTDPQNPANVMAAVTFFSGVLCFLCVNSIVHQLQKEDPTSHDQFTNEQHFDGSASEEGPNIQAQDEAKALKKTGLVTALAIALHNFPEGLATFAATLADPKVGFGLAIAIAIHNIPEGIAVAIPIFYADGNRCRAFWLATISGLAELIGAALGYGFLVTVLRSSAYAVLFGFVSGMMVAIVLAELLPTAFRHDPEGHIVTPSIFSGMIIMASSLLLFRL